MVIDTLLFDVGGVLLTNGWDHHYRAKAIQAFHLESAEFESRHQMTFDTFERGRMTLDEYLDYIVFFKKRSFSKDEFKKFMFEQSQPYPEMINLVKTLKKKYNVKIGLLSNEGKELMDYRIKTFGLKEITDFFVVSGFVHFRKPDPEIYQLALDTAQSHPSEVLYIDDRALLIEVAQKLGINGIHHINYETTQQKIIHFMRH